MQYKEPLYSIWGDMGGGILQQYTDRWHPVNATDDPYDPATQWVSGYYGYTGHYPRANSSFNRVSTDYLRLKSIELGWSIRNFRIYAAGSNLFTISPFDCWDPEKGNGNGLSYPLQRTVKIGLQYHF